MPDLQSLGNRFQQQHFQLHILFVCTGNICRSPLAEVMARARFDTGRYMFSSAGTHAMAGQAPAGSAQAVAAERGLDISSHKAIALDECEPPDVVIGMEQHHLVAARRRFPDLDVRRIRLLDHPVAIADPYGCDLNAYKVVADHIDRALVKISELRWGAAGEPFE